MNAITEKAYLRFDSLKFRDQLVLWAARHWIAASSTRPTMPPLVTEAFKVAGIPEATDYLHEALTIVSTRARRTILFCPVDCQTVSNEEARFLTLLTLVRQGGCEECAMKLLLRWVPAPAAFLARVAMRGLSLSVVRELGARPKTNPGSFGSEVSVSFRWPDPGASRLH